jgi:hypothetical protein
MSPIMEGGCCCAMEVYIVARAELAAVGSAGDSGKPMCLRLSG